ncbi:MAG: polysaccharide export protein [Deltaproteobacteria bacterium]|nr:polysaccharide export protein [Deltaproteobacteria bacterium]
MNPARYCMVVFFAALVGCAGAGYVPSQAGTLDGNISTAALGPGDVVNVRVYKDKDLSGNFQVSPAGTIDYPLLGTLKVRGLTASQLAEMIRDGLSRGYLRNPFVAVNVQELQSKRVYVLGQVAKPGTFIFTEGMTIIHAITLAGGFTKIARANSVVVTRTENGKDVRMVVPVDDISEGKAKNLHLLPGDIVFVPESIL